MCAWCQTSRFVLVIYDIRARSRVRVNAYACMDAMDAWIDG